MQNPKESKPFLAWGLFVCMFLKLCISGSNVQCLLGYRISVFLRLRLDAWLLKSLLRALWLQLHVAAPEPRIQHFSNSSCLPLACILFQMCVFVIQYVLFNPFNKLCPFYIFLLPLKSAWLDESKTLTVLEKNSIYRQVKGCSWVEWEFSLWKIKRMYLPVSYFCG